MIAGAAAAADGDDVKDSLDYSTCAALALLMYRLVGREPDKCSSSNKRSLY